MSVPKVTCPECGAGLKSPAGFEVGEAVDCPKCEASFAVPDPAARPRKAARATAVDDEDDDRPRKGKRARAADDEDDEDGGSYKSSPMRFVILGILVVVMLVLAYFLYDKRKREAEANKAAAPARLADSA